MTRRARPLTASVLLVAVLIATLAAGVLLSGLVPFDFATSDNHGDGEVDVRVQARQTDNGRVEVRAQSRTGSSEWTTHTPDSRFLPFEPDPGRWYSSSSVALSLPDETPDRSDEPGYTQLFVQQAIDYYERHGREAMLSHYNSPESIDGQWYMFIFDEQQVIVAHENPGNLGMTAAQVNGPDGYPAGRMVVAVASEAGAWVDYQFRNPASGQAEIKHSWIVQHDGLVFGSGWYEDAPSQENEPGAFTQSYVERALEMFRVLGREATLEYYNSPESIDGQWYMFIFDEQEVIVAHENPGNLGMTAAQVNGPDGYPAGRMVVAVASEAGAWVDYQFHNPASGQAEIKHSWIVQHDGLVFGSGWYENAPSQLHAPGAFTQSYVERALEMHRVLGREATLEYYNSPDSADGPWYMFIHQTDGTRVAHAHRSGVEGWLGSNLSDSGIDVTGFDYGNAILEIEASGWVSYVFVNPEDENRYQRKHSWIVTHDGLQFGSGWYDTNHDLAAEDPAGYSRVLVQQAIDRYDAEGREATLAHHNSPDSADGEWYVFVIDAEGQFVAHPTQPDLVGELLQDRGTDVTGFDFGSAFLAITENGWVSYVFGNPDTGQNEQKHTWLVRHDGLLFGAGWYEPGAYEAPDS